MIEIYTVKRVQQVFGFKDPRAARKIMRQMKHTEDPLLVTEEAIRDWMNGKLIPPEDAMRDLFRKGWEKDARRNAVRNRQK